MSEQVDVAQLRRHLQEVAWSPTVEISRKELLDLLDRVEAAEQAVAREAGYGYGLGR